MLTALCACDSSPIRTCPSSIRLKRSAESRLCSWACDFRRDSSEDAEMIPMPALVNLAAPPERLSCRFSRMCRFARGVAAARKVAMDMRWFKKRFCRKFSQWPRKAWDDELVHPRRMEIAALDATHLSRTFGPCGSCA